MTTRKLLIIIAAIGTLAGTVLSQSTVPTTPGVKAGVTVRRDSRAIPYIEAANDDDLYFVQGYVTASDRLWQMDLLRRVPLGQTAEIFGKPAIEEDKRWRRFGFAAVARESLTHLSPELRSALESYARGVNAYISTLDDKTLPVEFRILQYKPQPWTATDSVVIGKILADALSTTWRHDVVRASLQGLPKDKLADLTNQVTPYDVILFGADGNVRTACGSGPSTSGCSPNIESQPRGVDPYAMLLAAEVQEELRASSLSRIGFYAEDLAASNNWVISGKRTADGKPLLANDPHLRPGAPSIWYLTHLATPAMRVSGVTFPGVPGIVLGHNDQIAWGATNVGPDVQDLYIETFGADGKYKTPGGMAAPVTRREEIRVRGGETVVFDVVETRHGPIILEEGGKRYALKWTARDARNSEFEAFYFLNRAKDWAGFKKALSTYGGATQNFVYADVKGNIGWYAAGRIPIRKVGDGSIPYDGSTDDGEWTGYIPFEELPNLYNPKEGFIVTANQRIAGSSYKYTQMSRDAASPWRARRIYDLLKADTKVTMDKVAAVQYDSFNIPLANLAKEIVRQDGASAETLSLLNSWDGRMLPESKAALVTNEIRTCLANEIAEDNAPVPAAIIRERVLDRALPERTPRWLPKKFADYPAFMKSCESVANAALTKRLGTDQTKWTWATVSQSRFPHPLAPVPFISAQFATPVVGIAGSGQTPNVASAVSMRHITSPGNWDVTRHVIPLGQSGDPQSAHYKDQFEMWRTGAPAIFPFTKAAIEAATKVEREFK